MIFAIVQTTTFCTKQSDDPDDPNRCLGSNRVIRIRQNSSDPVKKYLRKLMGAGVWSMWVWNVREMCVWFVCVQCVHNSPSSSWCCWQKGGWRGRWAMRPQNWAGEPGQTDTGTAWWTAKPRPAHTAHKSADIITVQLTNQLISLQCSSQIS